MSTAGAPAPHQHLDPALVTVDIWTMPTGRIPGALLRAAGHPLRLRAGPPGLQFSKLLGTGSGLTFAVRDITPHRWALVCSWQTAQAAHTAGETVRAQWDDVAREHWHADLQPLSARGTWAGHRPFGDPRSLAGTHAGPVAAITRARLSWQQIPRFHRAAPPVSEDLRTRPGLLFALGMGESPVGRQGTFSLWRCATDLIEFAYRQPAHQQVMDASRQQSWYTEELFARFAVLATTGTVNGRPLPAPDGGP